jgi:hypothetical protein
MVKKKNLNSGVFFVRYRRTYFPNNWSSFLSIESFYKKALFLYLLQHLISVLDVGLISDTYINTYQNYI